jgi:hypothetical protein
MTNFFVKFQCMLIIWLLDIFIYYMTYYSDLFSFKNVEVIIYLFLIYFIRQFYWVIKNLYEYKKEGHVKNI